MDARLCRGCSSPFIRQSGPGRPRVWCSEACRIATYRGGYKGRPEPVLERVAVCPGCGLTFIARRRVRGHWRATCSAECARRRSGGRSKPSTPPVRACEKCGATTRTCGGKALCSLCAASNRRAHWRRKNATRRRGAVPVGPPISIDDLGQRDRWRCHLCRRSVNPAYRAPDPRSATFDHLVPVSAGGDDSSANLALAHWRCNSARGAGGDVQLALVG